MLLNSPVHRAGPASELSGPKCHYAGAEKAALQQSVTSELRFQHVCSFSNATAFSYLGELILRKTSGEI